MTRRVTMAVAMLVVAGAGLAALTWWPRDAKPDLTDPELVALGRTVYAEHCAACHGADLQGQANWQERGPEGKLPAPPHDETGHTWHHPDKQLFEITKLGTAAMAPAGYRTDMKGFGEVLSDREIWASIAYIKSRWPQPVREAQEARNR